MTSDQPVTGTEREPSRYVTVFHQLKETENGERGDRLVVHGEHLDDRYVMDDELEDFVPVARPIAVIDAGVEMEHDELGEWCNSHAGKAILNEFFPDIEPDDPTLRDVEEYLNDEPEIVTDGGVDQSGSEHLDWPAVFERTDPSDRTEYTHGFSVTRSTAFGNVLDELATWDGVTDVQLDSGAEHTQQNPNKPYANATYDDPGVVVRFQKDGQDMAAACDRWDNPRDNAQDLYHFLHETRMQEQRGTVTAESEYEKLRLPGAGEDAVAADPPAHAVLGVDRDASEEEIEEAYRQRAKETHPDHNGGGDSEAFQRVQRAKEAMLDE